MGSLLPPELKTALFEAFSLRIPGQTETPDTGACGCHPAQFSDSNPRVSAGMLHLTADSDFGRTGSSSPDGLSPLSLPADVHAFGECVASASDSEVLTISSFLHGFRDVSSEKGVNSTPLVAMRTLETGHRFAWDKTRIAASCQSKKDR
ncbi:unnamed protein product [Schistocephalus solidus]|uniref:Uncharacterized protein n=1 Tax=Schistocephalus solidus TaxID=70667 RepID=A0A183TC97_SCHSO|nr:unnamed protein product [Schistocephalus solidus]